MIVKKNVLYQDIEIKSDLIAFYMYIKNCIFILMQRQLLEDTSDLALLTELL